MSSLNVLELRFTCRLFSKAMNFSLASVNVLWHHTLIHPVCSIWCLTLIHDYFSLHFHASPILVDLGKWLGKVMVMSLFFFMEFPLETPTWMHSPCEEIHWTRNIILSSFRKSKLLVFKQWYIMLRGSGNIIVNCDKVSLWKKRFDSCVLS